MLCGTLGTEETNMFINPKKYNKSDCFDKATEVVTDKCSFVHKLIYDMACVKEVKEEFTKNKLSGNLPCLCPPACYSYEYIVSTSQSPWPQPGPETTAAYGKLVYPDKLNFTAVSNVTVSSDDDSGSGESSTLDSDGKNNYWLNKIRYDSHIL